MKYDLSLPVPALLLASVLTLCFVLAALAVLLLLLPDRPKRKRRQRRPPRAVLETELASLYGRCRELEMENEILMRENYRLRILKGKEDAK